MLDQIIIDNFATIEHLSFDLGPNLNIITGETGAGKSVLVEAISTALGGRADISMVRSGTQKAIIQIAGTVGDEDVIITREILSSGKSISKINGEMVSLSKLRAYCHTFVDIHGQYDNQIILDPQNHLSITDRYRSNTITHELERMHTLYEDYAEKKRAYRALCAEEAESVRQQDYYRFESEYIDNLNLYSGEDEELREQLDIMKNSEKIYESVNGAYNAMHEDDAAALSQLRKAIDYLNQSSSVSSEISALVEQLEEHYYALEDLSDSVRNMTDNLNYSDEEIDQTQERLSIIEDAKRKYRMSIDEILDYGQELHRKLEIIDNFDSEKSRLKDEMDRAYEDLEQQADHLSELRHINAERLISALTRQLQDLAFANSEFDIRFDRLPEIGPDGYDSMEFMISTNPGEPLRSLSKIASGGEISRIMLAFKHIIGDDDQVDTMIFDEIDTGISGRTAIVVGRKMREIAAHHQVICITHLPQIAAFGDDNFQIVKNLSDNSTHTEIVHLDEDGKLSMLAGMISGDPNSVSAKEAAQELMASTAN